MSATQREACVLRLAGYTYEFPSYWGRVVGGLELSIADVESINGLRWEVQAADNGKHIASEGPFRRVEQAIEAAKRIEEKAGPGF